MIRPHGIVPFLGVDDIVVLCLIGRGTQENGDER